VVVYDNYHQGIIAEPGAQLQQAGHGGTRRIAGKDPFLTGEFARHQRRIFVGYFLEVIDDVEIYVLGEEIFADTFGDVRIDLVLIENAGLLVFFENRPIRIDTPHHDVWILLFEVPAGPADGAPRAYTRNQVGDFPFGLFPYFRPGLFVMRLGVGKVVILVGFPRIGNFAFQPARNRVIGAGIFGVHVGGANDDLRTESAERIDFFLRLLVCCGENTAVTLDDGRQGQPHTGVARRAFDDGAARFEPSRRFRVFDHFHRHPVFDGVAGVGGLYLRQYRALHAAGNAVQFHQRRIADGFQYVVVPHNVEVFEG